MILKKYDALKNVTFCFKDENKLIQRMLRMRNLAEYLWITPRIIQHLYQKRKYYVAVVQEYLILFLFGDHYFFMSLFR